MENLIIQALNDTYIKSLKGIPQTKKVPRLISISDVNPLELIQFMTDNNIPNDAHFGGNDNGYDGYSDVCLCWNIEVPTTEKENLACLKKRFNNSSFTHVYKLLIDNGYKRIGSNSGLFKAFDDTTVYDMFLPVDLARLVEYYTLFFSLK